jgi:methylenetetrahydrofolate dehydrogenase (NADP+)/methenyltetrahydrofolate cyclohydrolase
MPPMTSDVIDGKALAAAEREQIASRVRTLRAAGAAVALDAVLVDNGDSAARVYADNQARGCDALGIAYRLHEMPRGSEQMAIMRLVRSLNDDASVTGVMVHMPLPAGVDADAVKALIDPAKDVEGVNPANIGNVIYGRSSLVPCTALATLRLIESTGIELRGKRVVVLGASATVGRPLAAVLMARDATVVSCNRWSWGIEDLCRTADVLVSAVGKPNLVTREMVKPGSIVIDVGVNRVTDAAGVTRTVGDVAFDQVSRIARFVSPVPGGVGPMTVAMLLANVVEAAAIAATGASGGR